MTAAPAPTADERAALLDEYSRLRRFSQDVRRLDEIERALGIGRYKSAERRAKGA